jgi:hypothetical protein
MCATTSQSAFFVSLRPLYKFIRTHQADYLETLNLKKDLGREYTKQCECLTGEREGECEKSADKIDEVQGIYVWGAFDARKYWHSVYLGKAGLGKSKKLLRARITEELKDERCCLWRSVLSKAKLWEAGPLVHDGGIEKWNKYIEKHWKRSIEKAGTTHIIWTPTSKLGNDAVRRLEAELIEALSPRANIQKPTPSNREITEATEVFSHFRQTIHYIRGLQDDRGPFNLRLAP